jgi:hypothetical protein
MRSRRSHLEWIAAVAAVLATACSDAARYPDDAHADGAAPDGGPRARYRELERLIHENLHLGPHFVMAVDARTIAAVSAATTDRDIPVLIEMLSDESERTAAAAASVLVTKGKKAVPALRSVPPKSPAEWRARDALRRMQDCYDEKLWNVLSADLCPVDRAVHRGERLDGPSP